MDGVAGKGLDSLDRFLHSHIGQWVVLTWRGDLFKPPKGTAYGTHLAVFVTCAHGTEVRGLVAAWLYLEKDGNFVRVGSLLAGIEATWILKYATLRQFECANLSERDVGFLQLPDLDQTIHADLSHQIIEIRRDARLDDFRQPGYPDDVAVRCLADRKEVIQGIDVGGEIVWVRIVNQVDRDRFKGKLLNQPRFNSSRKDNVVEFRYLMEERECALVMDGGDAMAGIQGLCRECYGIMRSEDKNCPQCGGIDTFGEMKGTLRTGLFESTKLEALKVLRERTGMGLAEATKVVESWRVHK